MTFGGRKDVIRDVFIQMSADYFTNEGKPISISHVSRSLASMYTNSMDILELMDQVATERDEECLIECVRRLKADLRRREIVDKKLWLDAIAFSVPYHKEAISKAINYLNLHWDDYASTPLIVASEVHSSTSISSPRSASSSGTDDIDYLFQGLSLSPITDSKKSHPRKMKSKSQEKEPSVKKTNELPRCPYDTKGYCRSYNIRFHPDKCKLRHENNELPKYKFTLADVPPDIHKNLTELFTKYMGANKVIITSIKLVINQQLKTRYDQYRLKIKDLRGAEFEEQKLLHGTNAAAAESIKASGFAMPADYVASNKCPVSKDHKHSLCPSTCEHCTKPDGHHKWDAANPCHMYGLGVYFANDIKKSNRYTDTAKTGRKMFVCDVVLGKPELIDRDLRKQDELHDRILPAPGYDSIYAKGRGKRSKSGLSVINDEYIVFNPYQIYPTYEITYNTV